MQEEIEMAAKHCAAAQAELRAMSTTKRKFRAMQHDSAAPTTSSPTHEDAKFCLVQMDVLNTLLCSTLCKHCLEPGLTVQESTKLGLATKLEVVCAICGIVSSAWNSPQQQNSMAFEVNI